MRIGNFTTSREGNTPLSCHNATVIARLACPVVTSDVACRLVPVAAKRCVPGRDRGETLPLNGVVPAEITRVDRLHVSLQILKLSGTKNAYSTCVNEHCADEAAKIKT